MLREPADARRIRPVRVALQNQRDALLAFAGVLDGKLAAIAHAHAIAEPLVREACLMHRLPTTSPAYWQGYFTLRRHLGNSYLDLLRFFLNHRRFLRSRRAERQGKSPRELMTGQGHPHWLTLLGLGPLQPQRA